MLVVSFEIIYTPVSYSVARLTLPKIQENCVGLVYALGGSRGMLPQETFEFLHLLRSILTSRLVLISYYNYNEIFKFYILCD